MKKGGLRLAVFLLALVIAASGCKSGKATGGKVKFFVTRDFGATILYAEELDVDSGQSVLDVLQAQLKVETGYGGRFVTGIEGVVNSARGGTREDWFFYANGILAAVSAADYYPLDGDVLWWDYHLWHEGNFIPAVTGAFPQPFLNGYLGKNPGTVILAGENCLELAREMESCLKAAGVKKIEIKAYEDALVSRPGGITLVIACWDELAGSPYWSDIQANRSKTGWFAELNSHAFFPYNPEGQIKEASGKSTGAVLATAAGLGDDRPIWLITALDMPSLEAALQALMEDAESVAGTFGFLIKEGKIIRLPD